MEDYTKYKLKNEDELAKLFEGRDGLFVAICKKCFKEFTSEEEPEFALFKALADEHGKSIIGSVDVDFLCNKAMTEKALKERLPDDAENIFVIACGLGVQTVYNILLPPETGQLAGAAIDAPEHCTQHTMRPRPKTVLAACDSVSYAGRHGLALTKQRCGACGQCYLNLTGGICPIAECSKSLVNGQCGGCKNNKCEIDKNKDCAWYRIGERLAANGRIDELRKQPIQLRDHSKVNFKLISKHIRAIRKKRLEGFYGGIYAPGRKELTEHLPLEEPPPPPLVILPLSQHIGTPAKPIVKAGDRVKKGQKIGEADGVVSGMVHSSISGTVTAVEPRRHPAIGSEVLSVVVSSDGKDEPHESIIPTENWHDLPPADIIAIIREKGIAGMGGAGFPTAAKLASATDGHLRPQTAFGTVLLNGCECEPYLTADHRVMLEYADDVVFGLMVLLKASGAGKGVIAIEENKHDAIELMSSKTAETPEIEVISVKTKYPQGAEKMLIKRALGIDLQSGDLPVDVGVLVNNVSTAKAVSDAIRKGLPLIERAVTVSGERIINPGNYMVRIGTPVQSLINHCGGITAAGSNNVKVKLGGPMMGAAFCPELQNTPSPLNSGLGSGSPPQGSQLAAEGHSIVPVTKTTTGIIAIELPPAAPNPCIRCGRCCDVCPMELLPLYYPQYAACGNWIGMAEKAAGDCMECGCCDYVCPSKIPIVDSVRNWRDYWSHGEIF